MLMRIRDETNIIYVFHMCKVSVKDLSDRLMLWPCYMSMVRGKCSALFLKCRVLLLTRLRILIFNIDIKVYIVLVEVKVILRSPEVENLVNSISI